MTGKTVGFIRRAVNALPAGRFGSSRATSPCTWSRAAVMSWPQSKSTLTSAAPRLVTLRTRDTPGMLRSASSAGAVTSSSIRSAGRSPASRLTCTRGKLTAGNSAVGLTNVASVPPTVRTSTRNTSERTCRCAQNPGEKLLIRRPPS